MIYVRIMLGLWSVIRETFVELGKMLLELLRFAKDQFLALCKWNGWVAAGITMVVLMTLAEAFWPEPYDQQVSSLFQGLILCEIFLWLIWKFMNRTSGGHSHHDHGHGHDH